MGKIILSQSGTINGSFQGFRYPLLNFGAFTLLWKLYYYCWAWHLTGCGVRLPYTIAFGFLTYLLSCRLCPEGAED